jgi:hypothetical protein
MISEVVSLINEYDKVFILVGLASYYYYNLISDPTEDGLSEVNLEYLQSIALATPNINAGKLPTGDVLKKISELLDQIRHHFVGYFGVEKVTGKYAQAQGELRYHMITETLFIRGEGYLVHVRELFREMFTPHDNFFIRHYGFTTQDIIDTFDKMEECFGCRMLLPNGRPHPVQTQKLQRWMHINKAKITKDYIETGEYLNDFVKTNPEVLVVNNGVTLYPLNQINTSDGLYMVRHFNDIQKNVAKVLSMKFGDNTPFVHPDKFKYEILNKTEIQARPIVEDDKGNFYLFNMNLAARNYFLIAQTLIEKADPNYYKNSFLGNRIQIAKDQFIERETLALFEKMLPEVSFYSGVYYRYTEPGLKMSCFNAQEGRYELDILGISQNATYIIEVKAGLVSAEAKRGAIASIETDLSGIVGDAICQSYRAYRYVANDPTAEFQTSDGHFVQPVNRTNVFRISISFSYVGSLIASLSRLKEAGIFDEVADYAWTINIFDLMAVAGIMEDEIMFIDYLSKRLKMYHDQRLVNVDEMDMLGLYLERDMKLDKAFRDADTIQLHKFSGPISDFFEGRAPLPKKKKT